MYTPTYTSFILFIKLVLLYYNTLVLYIFYIAKGKYSFSHNTICLYYTVFLYLLYRREQHYTPELSNFNFKNIYHDTNNYY